MDNSNFNKSKKKIILLLLIIIFHFLPVIISAFYDKGIQRERENTISLSKPDYWLWFFTWWSAWASLLTIPWAIGKFFIFSRKKTTYGEELSDLIITETNLISGLVFCFGGFLLTVPNKKVPLINYPFFGRVKTIKVYIFYNLFWHILAPSLVFFYFCKYSQVNLLRKKKRISLLVNLINPILYFLYIISRPLMSKLTKTPPYKSYTYPRDYPYPFFFWSVGEFADSKEIEKNYFWHSWSPWLRSLFWIIVIFFLGFLSFSVLFYFLLGIKEKDAEKMVAAKLKWK